MQYFVNKSAWTARIMPQRCKVVTYTRTYMDVRTEPHDTTPCFRKRSQYTFRHIFSKRGTILTIFGSKIPR